jgi:hypothetical protein
MFGQPPADYTPTAVEKDMRERYLPTPEAIKVARTMLLATPEANVALVPMFCPGKQRGIWTMGQPVETVPGIVVLAKDHDLTRGEIDRGEYRTVAGYGQALTYVGVAATMHADGIEGVIAHAVIERSGHAAVFEDFPAGGLYITENK